MSTEVLILGGAGYIGCCLGKALLASGYRVKIFDSFFFGTSPLADIAGHPDLEIIKGDIRDQQKLDRTLSPGMNIIHLASLSNDPSCDLNPRWSHEVNYQASVRIAQMAKDAGCPRFSFASSCSVYGYGGGEKLKETSLCNPVSLYAELKLKAESEILSMAGEGFHPVSLRQATIFGLSPRMRFDLAINQMTLHAVTKRKIFVLGGGQQWRPFLHVRDAAQLFRATLEAPENSISGQIFNAGSDENNLKICDLAYRVRKEIPGTEIEIVPDDADRRDYNVDFSKIKRVLDFTPTVSVSRGIAEIREFLEAYPRTDFNSPQYFNVKRLKETGLKILDTWSGNKVTD